MYVCVCNVIKIPTMAINNSLKVIAVNSEIKVYYKKKKICIYVYLFIFMCIHTGPLCIMLTKMMSYLLTHQKLNASEFEKKNL